MLDIAEFRWKQSVTCSTCPCFIDRYASRLEISYNIYCRSFQKVDEGNTVKHAHSNRSKSRNKSFCIDELQQAPRVVQRGHNICEGILVPVFSQWAS